ncbi:integrase [Candidatus Woesearchaeota archaeon]|nr:MAG: integrase [Candidatus Woesearchaeota archaeon]
MQALKQLETELKLRGFSEKTVKTYLFFNKDFLSFIKKPPQEATEEDVKSYIAHLLFDKKLKPSSVNLALCTLRFFYKKILEQDIFSKIESPKLEKKIPTVLTRDEIKQMIASAKNQKHRILVELLYSAGLRVSEAVKMRINDLDLKEKIAVVRAGKGKKDRIVILSTTLVKDLQDYIPKLKEKFPENEFLFPSPSKQNQPITPRQAEKIIKSLAEKAGIKKRVYCHALRASFATHLLEQGTDIRVIQTLLGHANLATTERYTKVSLEQIKKVKNPLDFL